MGGYALLWVNLGFMAQVNQVGTGKAEDLSEETICTWSSASRTGFLICSLSGI